MLNKPKMSEKPETGKKNVSEIEPPMVLIGYNLISGCLWSFCLLNVFATYLVFQDAKRTFTLTAPWTIVIQCFAIIEIYNSATGKVRSPLFTTTLQVASRLLVVLGLWTYLWTSSPGNYSIAYFTCHLAWCCAEVIRYYYYATHLMAQHSNLIGNGIIKEVPPNLEWLRYNAFLILYPLGISSECYMIYRAVQYLITLDSTSTLVYAVFLSFTLLTYIPGTIVLFGHMLKQRSKFSLARGKKVEEKKLKKSN